MTKSNTLELARQGDVKAIAGVIAYLMEPQSVSIKASLNGENLELIAETSHTPDQEEFAEKIHKIVKLLNLNFINKVAIYGKIAGSNSLAWHQELKLYIDNHQSAKSTDTTNSSEIEEVSTWEKALEAVIDSVIGSDFNQVELQDFIDKLTLEKPHITPEEICNKIIDKKSLQSGLFGAVTGVGGLALLPVAIPTNLYTSWKIQAATVMAVAHVYGYQPSKTDTCLVLFGAADSKMQAFKTMGIEAAKVATKKAVDLYMTREILKSVFRLSLREAATKMAQKALISKMIPLIGAPIGFGFDWFTTQAVGKVAIKYYGGK